MYGGTYYGALVFGAGLVVTSPAPESNGYGTCPYGAHVYGAGCIVTSFVPVGPEPPQPDVEVIVGSGENSMSIRPKRGQCNIFTLLTLVIEIIDQ
jgi:hypothetical protein